MASTSHRASLEPLTPALVGIGLLHVLGAMVLWIVLPMLPSGDAPTSKLPANLVWRTPADFVGAALPLEPPGVIQNEVAKPSPKPVAAPAVTADKPVPAASPASVAKSERVDLTLPKNAPSPLSLPPPGLTIGSPGNSGTVRQVPPDTLAMLEKSMGSTLGMDSVMAGQAARILGVPPPALPPVSVQMPPPPAKTEESAPPPVQPGQGREANKYITLSAIVDTRAAPTTTLSLFDIVKLNDLERERKAHADASGLDAVEGALQKTLMNAWIPPAIGLVPANQRRVGVELTVLKDGTIKDALIITPSGSGALDASVRAALARVTKIPESLPASYTKEHYAVRVNLQIE